jgi:hypothetical protein
MNEKHPTFNWWMLLSLAEKPKAVPISFEFDQETRREYWFYRLKFWVHLMEDGQRLWRWKLREVGHDIRSPVAGKTLYVVRLDLAAGLLNRRLDECCGHCPNIIVLVSSLLPYGCRPSI